MLWMKFQEFFPYLLIVIFSNYLISFIDTNQLLHKSHCDIEAEKELLLSDLWSPKTPSHLIPDYRYLEICDTSDFELLQSKLNIINDPNYKFEWTSINLFNSEKLKQSYILLGGSYRHSSLLFEIDQSIAPRKNASMYLCYLEQKSDENNLLGFGLKENPCILLNQQFNPYNEHEFLGATSESIKINHEINLFVYCDPLWRATSKVPVGRCFAHLIKNGKIQKALELADFCQSGMQVATPCAAGHSIALSMNLKTKSISKKNSGSLSDVNLWVGEPLSQPYGRVQIVTDLYGSMNMITIPRPLSNSELLLGSDFGYAITENYATAPGLPNRDEEFNQTDIVRLFGLDLSQTTSSESNQFFGSIASYIKLNRTDQFSGFGISIARVQLNGLYSNGIIIGAPYYSNNKQSNTDDDDNNNNDNNNNMKENKTKTHSNSSNHGRVYIFCELSTKIKSDNDYLKQILNYPNDYIDSPELATNFGFSLTNLGDIDGDGNEDIGISAPDLKNQLNQSSIYLIRVFSNCTFDHIPLQILKSSLDQNNYGIYLPSHSIDLDFNNRPDLVVPLSINVNSNANVNNDKSNLLIYASRQIYVAECHFTFPPWLSIRRIFEQDKIPIQLIVYFQDPMNNFNRLNDIEKLINKKQFNLLKHQINSDWNMNEKLKQRFNLFNNYIKSSLDLKQNHILIDLNLQAQMNVEDMVNLETKDGSVYIAYRFVQPCYGSNHNTIDNLGSCPNGGWLKRPRIDWSKCLAKIPLSRYVCYPSPQCSSDVTLHIMDVKSGRILKPNYLHENQSYNFDQSGILQDKIPIEFGNKNSSRQQIRIEIYNLGPTFAHGTNLEIQFHGNLRFSRLEMLTDSDHNASTNTNNNSDVSSYEEKFEQLMVDVSANETWINCPIGTIPPPLNMELKKPSQILLLTSYYDNFMNFDQVNYSLGAGVTIKIISGTSDPVNEGNSIRIDYEVTHKPRIRISYGPDELSSKMDNRTKPSARLPGLLNRVQVSDLGPKVEHTLQVEYLGPSNKLKNVTMTLWVPIELNPEDRENYAIPYILYMFNQIRAISKESGTLEWIDTRPKILGMTRPSNPDEQTIGYCTIRNEEQIINPRGMIGMDSDKVYSRNRRDALPEIDYSEEEKLKPTHFNNPYDHNSSNTLSSHPIMSSNKFPAIEFRRLQKEVIQCDRVGNRIQKPICAEIICHVDELYKNRPVLVKVTGWLWARTLFAKHIADVDLVTTLSVDQGQIPVGVTPSNEPVGHFYLAQTFFFPQIRPKLLHQIPIWPVIVGVVLGLIFLYLLIILLYLLGFFRRRKSALRKAMLSKGGAEAIYERDKQEEVNNSLQTPQSEDKNRTKKKTKKKRKKELEISAPTDISCNTNLEQQKLIQDNKS